MRLSIDKSRFAFVLIIVCAVLLVGVLIWYNVQLRQQLLVKVRLHAVPTRPVAMSSVTPTATPTASIKFYPTKGIVK